MTTAQAIQDSDNLENILRQIQGESLDEVCARESSTFDRAAAPFANRLVLFGAGPLGKGTLIGLRQAGVEPIAFADNDSRLWGKQVHGIEVLSPDDAARQYGASACFVVTIYNGSLARTQLTRLGCQHVAAFAPLFWKYAEVFTPTNGIDLPHRLRDEMDQISACYAILHDRNSRRELIEQLVWRYWLDYGVLSPALSPQHTYFPFELLTPVENEVFVDCGSFDGDTIRSFTSHWNGKFQRAFAFEPDPSNREALSASINSLGLNDQVSIFPYVVGNQSGAVSFSRMSSAASHIDKGGTAPAVECRRLDDIKWPVSPTYIKMDIESAEPEALTGATNLLSRHHPVLAICTYHRSSHLWEIPTLIHSIAPEYRIFLRRYAEECWEGVCYAIPPSRLKRI